MHPEKPSVSSQPLQPIPAQASTQQRFRPTIRCGLCAPCCTAPSSVKTFMPTTPELPERTFKERKCKNPWKTPPASAS